MHTSSTSTEVKKSLRHSILDGSAYSAMLGLTQDHIAPFALVLKATTAQIGLLTSIPNLAMALFQLASPSLVERAGSRKKLILPVVLIHALLWLPILLVPHLFPGQAVWWLIAFFTLSTVFGSLGNPAWGSMMADLVPQGVRGRYFGLRGRICGLITLSFFFIGGIILYFFSSDILLGFSIIFGGAMLFRLVSWYFLSRMYEPPLSKAKGNHPGLASIVRKLGSSNLGRFIVFILLFYFAIYMAAPFFAIFMLRDLGFGYITYVLLMATCALSNLTFLPFWGRISDRLGNIRVLKITSVLIPLVPLLWIINHQFYYLVIVQIFSGCMWGGFTLASVNFLYDASPSENRTRWVALFNAASGGAICLGALFGGCIATHLPPLLGYNLLTLFLLSGLLRGFVVITMLHHLSEVRKVQGINIRRRIFGEFAFRLVPKPVLQPAFSPMAHLNIGKVSFIKQNTERQHETALENRSPPLAQEFA